MWYKMVTPMLPISMAGMKKMFENVRVMSNFKVFANSRRTTSRTDVQDS